MKKGNNGKNRYQYMTTQNTPHGTRPQGAGKRSLQRLRRQAGFRSAKEFAAKVGIPSSTYSRYERAPEGPCCGIPIASAWAMADALGCSIDHVVGRADIEQGPKSDLGGRIAAMNVLDREIVTAFVEFVERRGAAPSGRQA